MPRWTEERRKKQAEAIRRWKPWEKSTGPKTAEGKAVCAMNAVKPYAEERKLLRLNDEFRKTWLKILRREEAEV